MIKIRKVRVKKEGKNYIESLKKMAFYKINEIKNKQEAYICI